MPKFKVIHTTVGATPDSAEFRVVFLDGNLVEGQSFVTYETHHAVKWIVSRVEKTPNSTILQCTTKLGLGFDGNFAGATVDTSKTERPSGFNYAVK